MAGIREFSTAGINKLPIKWQNCVDDLDAYFDLLHCFLLVGLAFVAAVGICLVVLGCALPTFNNWWPMFVLIFYFLSPLPTVISRRNSQSFDSSSNACAELSIFLTTGIIISAIGLPLVLAHVAVIKWGACALVLAGNIIVFITILGYFIVFSSDEFDYNMWC
ncbi:leptin receptor gene-related protein [Octopus sinensis]|uniref:Leptin receptor gene-related protein n=1 Tax=Octopus sinensis TaxID=2607531 RepID=A0A6P7SMB7_9MOLL|nr:leptin receptor gene-related protein [Octopus sinensis]